MGDLALEIRRQIDNGNGPERALLGADTTTDTETLGDEGKPGVTSDFDAELSGSHDLLHSQSAVHPWCQRDD